MSEQEKIRHLEAEKQNWLTFRNYFESQLTKFFSRSQSPPSKHTKSSISMERTQNLSKSPMAVQHQQKIWNISRIDTASISMDRDRSPIPSNHKSNDQKKNQKNQDNHLSKGYNSLNPNSLQVQLQLDSDNLNNLEEKLKKKEFIIEKQREYIKLIDQEVWVYKQSTLLKKDQQIERRNIENNLLQNQNLVLLKELDSCHNKISSFKQENTTLMNNFNLQFQRIKDKEKEYQLSFVVMKKEIQDGQNFIEQIQQQFDFTGEKDLIKILKVIEQKQQAEIQMQNEKIDQRELIEQLKQQIIVDKIQLQSEYQRLYDAQLEDLVQVNKSLLKHQAELLYQIDELNIKIKTIAILLDQMQDQKLNDEILIEQLKKEVQEVSKIGDTLRFKVDHLQTDLNSEILQHHQSYNELQNDSVSKIKEVKELQNSITKLQDVQTEYLKLKQDHEAMIVVSQEKYDTLKMEFETTKSASDREPDKQSEDLELKTSELDNQIQLNYKKMSVMKEKLTNSTQNLQAYSKKVGIVLQCPKQKHGDENLLVDEIEHIMLEITQLIDSLNEIHKQIQVDHEKKMQKETEKQRGLLQQNIQLKLDNKKIEQLTILNEQLQEQNDELHKNQSKLKLDNKNLSVIAKRDSQIEDLTLGIPNVQINHRKSLNLSTTPVQPSQQMIQKFQNDFLVMKKELSEAQAIILTITANSTDRQVNFLNKRVIELQNQIKQKQQELDNQITDQDKQKIEYDQTIDRLEDEVDERDERLQELMKQQLLE